MSYKIFKKSLKKQKFSFRDTKSFMKLVPQARLLIQNQGANSLYLIVGLLIIFILVTSIMYGKNINYDQANRSSKDSSSINKVASFKINIFKKSSIKFKKLTKIINKI